MEEWLQNQKYNPLGKNLFQTTSPCLVTIMQKEKARLKTGFLPSKVDYNFIDKTSLEDRVI